MGVVHLSAHLRRMHDAVFGAATRGAVLLGNARSPITCSALAACPAWECTTPDDVQRPRHRLRNTPPPRPCHQTHPLWHVFQRGWASSRASTAVRHSPPCICPLPFGECTGPNKVQRPGSASFSAMQELNSHATAACMPSLHAMCHIRLVPIACNAPARSIISGRGRARGRKPSASKCVRVAMCRWRSQRMALRFAD